MTCLGSQFSSPRGVWVMSIFTRRWGYFNQKPRQQLIHSSLKWCTIVGQWPRPHLRAKSAAAPKFECKGGGAARHDSLIVISSEKYWCPEDPSAQMCMWKHRTALDSLNLSSAVSTAMAGETEVMDRRRAARSSTQTPPDRVLAFTDALLRWVFSQSQTLDNTEHAIMMHNTLDIFFFRLKTSCDVRWRESTGCFW